MQVLSANSQAAFGASRNLAANIALRGLRAGTAEFSRVSERLATGSRINRPSDDVATFRAIESSRAQLAGLKSVLINTQNASLTLDMALGGMSEVFRSLTSLRSVAMRALGAGIASADKSIFQDEAEELLNNIDRVVANTKIGGNKVLDGSGDFHTTGTDGAFDDVRVKRIAFAPGADHRDFVIDVTRLASRATLLTNLDLAGTASVAPNGSTTISVTGPNGTTQLDMRPASTAREFAAQVNAASAQTGVFASSHISTGAELRFDGGVAGGAFNIENELEFTVGSELTFDVSVGGQVRTVTVTATGDQDNDGNLNITVDDLQTALNAANLGSFSVIGGVDAGAGTASMAIRHAGGADFTLSNFAAAPGSTLNAASRLLGGTFTGTEPTGARYISEGVNAGAGPFQIAVQIFDDNGARTSVLDLLNASPAEIIAAMAGIAEVTDLGVDSNGNQRYRFDAEAGVNAFRFLESGPDRSDAANLGLLGDSGGGDGLASRGMAVLVLYSTEFGAGQQLSVRNTSPRSTGWGLLNEANPTAQGLAPQGGYTAVGMDAIATINDQRVVGNGFHLEFGTPTASLALDLAPALGAGSFTNALNRALSLNYADPLASLLVGTRPLSQRYQGDAFALTDVNDGMGQLLADNGIIDRLDLRVWRQTPGSTARNGLGFQLTDSAGGREYIGIRSFDTSVLGGLPTSEGGPGTRSGELLMGAGTLSQLRRGGAFSLEGGPEEVRQALAVIDRAMEQVLREQTNVGIYKTVTLDRNRDYMESLSDEVANGLSDIASVDVAADAAALAGAQLRVQATTTLLAQANQLPQTLLQLLG